MQPRLGCGAEGAPRGDFKGRSKEMADICKASDLMTPEELGAIIGWHPESVRRALRQRRLRAGVKVGRRWYVKRVEFFESYGREDEKGAEGDFGAEGVACRA